MSEMIFIKSVPDGYTRLVHWCHKRVSHKLAQRVLTCVPISVPINAFQGSSLSLLPPMKFSKARSKTNTNGMVWLQ